jgi:hypothetical protein
MKKMIWYTKGLFMEIFHCPKLKSVQLNKLYTKEIVSDKDALVSRAQESKNPRRVLFSEYLVFNFEFNVSIYVKKKKGHLMHIIRGSNRTLKQFFLS